jgi:hypothetical protein
METFYLVVYENVGSGGVAKCSGLDKTDHLHIFYTENSKNIKQNFKQEIHNDLRIDLGEYAYQEAYNCLKPILKKYGK